MAGQKQLISGNYFEFDSGTKAYRVNRITKTLEFLDTSTNNWVVTTTVESDSSGAIEQFYAFDETNQRWVKLDASVIPPTIEFIAPAPAVAGVGDGTGVSYDPIGGSPVGSLELISLPGIQTAFNVSQMEMVHFIHTDGDLVSFFQPSSGPAGIYATKRGYTASLELPSSAGTLITSDNSLNKSVCRLGPDRYLIARTNPATSAVSTAVLDFSAGIPTGITFTDIYNAPEFCDYIRTCRLSDNRVLIMTNKTSNSRFMATAVDVSGTTVTKVGTNPPSAYLTSVFGLNPSTALADNQQWSLSRLTELKALFWANERSYKLLLDETTGDVTLHSPSSLNPGGGTITAVHARPIDSDYTLLAYVKSDTRLYANVYRESTHEMGTEVQLPGVVGSTTAVFCTEAQDDGTYLIFGDNKIAKVQVEGLAISYWETVNENIFVGNRAHNVGELVLSGRTSFIQTDDIIVAGV